MSEELPPSLRRKLLKEAFRMYMSHTTRSKEQKVHPMSPKELILSKLTDDRGREILEKAESLYPEATEYALAIIAKMIEQGMIKELDAETLLALLNRLGVPVKPDIRIKFVKHGREVSFKEYVED